MKTDPAMAQADIGIDWLQIAERAAGGAMTNLSNYDPLTGLLCRSAYEVDKNSERLTSGVVAVLVINFDRFSLVNRQYGRALGDFVLAMQAGRFDRFSDDHTLGYRYEGDCFLQLLLSDRVLTPDEIRQQAQNVQRALQQTIALADESLDLSCTVVAAERPVSRPIHHVVTDALLYRSEFRHQGPGQVYMVPASETGARQVS